MFEDIKDKLKELEVKLISLRGIFDLGKKGKY